jgi:hypothetical protein
VGRDGRISSAAHGLVRTPRPGLGHTASMKTQCGSFLVRPRRVIVVLGEAVYLPKFAYLWTLGVGRFPDALPVRGPRHGRA